jgi:hypothetical protein
MNTINLRFWPFIKLFIFCCIFSNTLKSQVIIGQKVQIINNLKDRYVHLWIYKNEDKNSLIRYVVLNRGDDRDNRINLDGLNPHSRIVFYLSKEAKKLDKAPKIQYIPLTKIFENQIPNSTTFIRVSKGFFGQAKFITSYVLSNQR